MRALIIGSTGLVGSHLLNQLLENTHYQEIICLVRKPCSIKHPKLNQVVFDFDTPDPELIKADHIYCAIGTTLAKAGSKKAQFKIDYSYPAGIATIAVKNGATHFALVSSVGASADSSNFYLATKGQLEQSILNNSFKSFICVRPSFILGQRSESRLGEKIGIFIAKILNPIMVGPLKKFKAVQASAIANTMIQASLKNEIGFHLIESPYIK